MYLFKEVVEWAEARNIIKGSSVDQQILKVVSEIGELADNLAKGRYEAAKDDVGDSMVVLYNLLAMSGVTLEDLDMSQWDVNNGVIADLVNSEGSYTDFVIAALHLIGEGTDHSFARALAVLMAIAIKIGSTPEECLDIAYNEIKDRKGRMENGVFIKEGDVA